MPKRRLHKGGRVEPVFPRSLIAWQIALLPRHLIGARVEARPCGLNIQSDWRWEAALRRQDRVQLPALGNALVAGELGQLISKSSSKPFKTVKSR